MAPRDIDSKKRPAHVTLNIAPPGLKPDIHTLQRHPQGEPDWYGGAIHGSSSSQAAGHRLIAYLQENGITPIVTNGTLDAKNQWRSDGDRGDDSVKLEGLIATVEVKGKADVDRLVALQTREISAERE